MTRGYKMVVLLAMLNAGKFPGEIAIDELADEVERLATRTTRAAADLGDALTDRASLIRMLERNPIEAWTGGLAAIARAASDGGPRHGRHVASRRSEAEPR